MLFLFVAGTKENYSSNRDTIFSFFTFDDFLVEIILNHTEVSVANLVINLATSNIFFV
jgi:hypothetical protein